MGSRRGSGCGSCLISGIGSLIGSGSKSTSIAAASICSTAGSVGVASIGAATSIGADVGSIGVGSEMLCFCGLEILSLEKTFASSI